jgi:hypothetical protein
MRQTSSLAGTVSSCLLVVTLSFGSRPAPAQDAVSDAIDRGIEYLLEQVKTQKLGEHKVGQLALEVYALVVAGVSVDHPLIRECFELLHQQVKGSNHTYTVSCYIFALDAAISQIENDLLLLAPQKVQLRFRDDPAIGKEYRPHLTAAVNTIIRLQNSKGAWRYGPSQDFDNSNVQFAVLALGVGAKRRVPIEPSVWQGVADHFTKGQDKSGPEVKERLTMMAPQDAADRKDQVKLISRSAPERRRSAEKEPEGKEKESDATTFVAPKTVIQPENPEIGTESIPVHARGWSYEHKPGATWNMTCAGLSSLLLARENLRDRLGPELRETLNTSIRDGYGWLMSRWSPTASYYGMYSLEKVADIGGVKAFGQHDWYAELSRHLVGAQRADGSWPGGGSHGENARVATSFALLILNRATTLLTMTPASRILVSGRSSGGDDPNDRSWVYVPDIDTTIHYPTLLRQIRQRPSLKLIRFLHGIVQHYQSSNANWMKGELIPEMAKVRDAMPNKTARGIIEGYLAEITGHKYDNFEDYLKWHRRWERVILIGNSEKADRIPDLLKYHESTGKSAVLKEAVIWALVKCKAREALPLFLADLSNPDARIRRAAYSAFRAFFIEYPPPFDATAAPGPREAQAVAVREWYEKQAKASANR